jgi:23S rRNA (adenine2503-C2)-methyltransferase
VSDKIIIADEIDPLAAFPEELGDFFESMGEPRFRGNQLFSWLHARGVVSPSLMTDLPTQLREKLEHRGLEWPARVGKVLHSQDGTRKLQIILNRGGTVETVLIPDGDKLAQCVSTQVGCAVRCKFCRSGHAGLKRNLTAAEIMSQVQLAKKYYRSSEQLRNIVFMGVGEPLHNPKTVLRSVALLGHPRGLDLSSRRITVSTVGFVRGIDLLARETGGEVALAVSLHASNDATRFDLVPGIKDPLSEIVKALERYPMPRRRRITIEYVLVQNVNDSIRDAKELVKLLSSLRVKVNLLPLNPHDKTDLQPPSDERVSAFQDVLLDKGVSAFVRKRRGADIGAACGQLI